jgi:RNA polymerase sigma-70 factor (ECF subfamily)
MPDAQLPRDDDEEDRTLIARWQGGDERAATRLVERHAPSVARFLASLGEREEAQELVQDTFVRAFGALESWRGEASFRSWLFTIARRLVLDRRRFGARQRRLSSLDDDGVQELAGGDDVLGGVIAAESAVRLRAAVSSLTALQREVFLLRVIEGMSYKEIAAVAATTEGAARVHYHNAMRAVRDFLDA